MIDFIRRGVVNLSLKALLNFGKAEFETFLEKRSYVLAQKNVQKILDNEGIAHCFYCPTRAPLRKHEGKYVCNKHFQAASMAPVLACLLVVLLVGCISPATHRKKLKESHDLGYAAADKECLEIQKIALGRIGNCEEKLRCCEAPGSNDCEGFPWEDGKEPTWAK